MAKQTVKPSTPWVANQSIPKADQEFKQGTRDITALADFDFSQDWIGASNSYGFTWGADTYQKAWNSTDQTMEVTFPPVALNADSWVEVNYEIGRDLTEVWVSFDFKCPSNYFHRGTSNNKFFAIWMDDYSQNGTGATFLMQIWPLNDGSGESNVTYNYRDVPTDTNTGHRQPFNFTTADDKNVFVNYVIRVKTSSAPGNADGIIQVWAKRPTDSNHILRMEELTAELNLPPDPANGRGWSKGYLQGYANEGFEFDTVMTYDNFKLGPSAQAVGFTVPGA